MNTTSVKFYFGEYQNSINQSISKLKNDKIVERIWNKDYTVWSDKPEEVSNRLDWLQSPIETLSHIDEINSFVESVKADGYTNALLLGMGGSSLAPEVFKLSFGVKEGYLDLSVLDSTDPAQVLTYTNNIDPAKTLYIVSTKSGGTIETLSFFKYFFTLCKNKLGAKEVGKHFLAITDPGSKLEEMATELSFRKIFVNNPNIGGRYSVLSFFGSVPAALLGVDLMRLQNNAKAVADNSKDIISISAELGIAIGELAQQGRDKLTFIYSKKINSFGTWVEQLIAESTGKNGIGILPIENESLENPKYYGDDRVFVYTHFENDDSLLTKIENLKTNGHPVIEIILKDEYDLGGEFLRWEFATAVAGWKLGIQPFNQPNVESAKIEAKVMINNYLEKGELPKLDVTLEENGIKLYADTKEQTLDSSLNKFLNNLIDKTKYNYVSIQAYVTPTKEVTNTLQELRIKIQKKYRSTVTVGFGPRFLHSTGQLHKGDAGKGLFIQFTSSVVEDVSIPDKPGIDESNFTFGVLKTAQLLGDRQALLNANRKVITIDLDNNIIDNIKYINNLIT